jgi:uncharacterized protein YciI
MSTSTGQQPQIFRDDKTRTLFLLRHRFQKPPQEFADAYDGHRAYIDRHFETGVFLTAGPTVPWDGGMILARAESREAIAQVVAGDPLIEAGITEYEITEWKTTIRTAGFAALLDELQVED